MSSNLWQPHWVSENTVALAMHSFRLVETQYIAATMQLVDSADEQNLLEEMLEGSKPPMPKKGQGVHYLLAAPFRYLPQTGSRFRAVNSPGIWYGADDPFCACAEIAHWRQRFLLDSSGLAQSHVCTEHSMYEAAVKGIAIDLLALPWSDAAALWKNPIDYTETQRLASLVRDSEAAQWIHYESVRATGHQCAAVFNPSVLTMMTQNARYEQWHCFTTKDRVTMSNGRTRFDF